MKKTVFITGSTRGIGKAIAFEYLNDGYTVILNGRNRDSKSNTLLKIIQKISPESNIYYFDITNEIDVKKNCQKIINRYKNINILINNAGIAKDSTFLKMSFDDWDNVIRTNLYGPFFIIKQILPTMILNNFGRIINISSVVALSGNYGQVNYAASKAGILGLTKSLAIELAKYNITVNAVCPGFTNTEMVSKIPLSIKNTIIKKIPLKRFALPKEIAQLILFLGSEKSNYITGSIININGGYL